MLGALRRQAVHEDAMRILETNNLPCKQVVAVDRDSILYVNQQGRPRTAWLHLPPDGKVQVRMEAGFEAEPPPGWHEMKPGDRF